MEVAPLPSWSLLAFLIACTVSCEHTDRKYLDASCIVDDEGALIGDLFIKGQFTVCSNRSWSYELCG